MSGVEPTHDIDVLRSWVGRTEELTEVISPLLCERMQQTLDRHDQLVTSDPFPPLWHFLVHNTSASLSDLGRDGHPKRGGFLPPVALPRRMWAGGRFTFHSDILVGDAVTKASTIQDVTLKSGRSGSLCFVTVLHDLIVDGDVKISEEQDLVFREDPAPDAPTPEPKSAPTNADWTRTVEPSEVMLFRYSALTFNGHRIHYDRNYSRDVEGYEGLIFHGPLTATLLADLAVAESGRSLATFSFRALSPLFDTAPFTLSGNATDQGADLWATTPNGGLAMQATATLRDG